ncbi:LysR family transcriptional regulator [Nocardia pseudovaccinii]|uniref:LysR family transcriptional regulator n=1 Tax=Nocardia pseudovaccinii TaxID=189540 RepID=UPI0007A3CFB7|nr:LysR family transcriptional regulator [Nocardia pseudovaccinii]
MDDVEIREVRYFLAVAEELNFTRAAQRLGMAQPPLSAAIGKLERKLGVTLFERTSRRVTLTPAGAVLLEQGRLAVDGLRAALTRTRRAGADLDHLVVAIKPSVGTTLVGTVMHSWAQDPCRPTVRVLFGHPGGPAAAVRDGAADLAILHAPFDERGLDSELLLVEPRVAVLSAHHPLARRRVLHRGDLAGEKMPHWGGAPDPTAAAYWAGADTPPTPLHQVTTYHIDGFGDAGPPEGPEINSIDQLLDAVALHDAVAYVPASFADQHQRPELAFIPVSDLSPSKTVAAWPDNCRSLMVADFVQATLAAAQ